MYILHPCVVQKTAQIRLIILSANIWAHDYIQGLYQINKNQSSPLHGFTKLQLALLLMDSVYINSHFLKIICNPKSNIQRDFIVIGGNVHCSENFDSPVPCTHPQLRRYTGTDTLPSFSALAEKTREGKGSAAWVRRLIPLGQDFWILTLAHSSGQHQAIHLKLLNCLLGKENRI